MEIYGRVSKILGKEGAICFAQQNQGSNVRDMVPIILEDRRLGGKEGVDETIVIDSKRRRVDETDKMENNGLDVMTTGPKNLLEAGPGIQARLQQ